MQKLSNSMIGKSLCSDVCQQCLNYTKTEHQNGCKMGEIFHILKRVNINYLDVLYENLKKYKDPNRICQSHYLPLEFYLVEAKKLGCKDCVDFGRERVESISQMNKHQAIKEIIQPIQNFKIKELQDNVEKKYQKSLDECKNKYNGNLSNDRQTNQLSNNQIKEYQIDIEEQWDLFLKYRKYNEFIKLSGPKEIHSQLHKGYRYTQKQLIFQNNQEQNPLIDDIINSYYHSH